MTTLAPMSAPRRPFAALDGARLQKLTNMKNRQNGLVSSPLSHGKSPLCNMTKASPLGSGSSGKRRLPSPGFDDFDSENVDPAIFASPSKRSKCDMGMSKPSSFSLVTSKPSVTPYMPSTSIPTYLQTPKVKTLASPVRAPLSAPAGRSPPRKSIAQLKARRTSAPFTRIDPPSFTRPTSSADLPFSLNEALAGSLNQSTPTIKPRGSEQTMPRNWFFDIYEDTPDDEASNMMEHSTLTLDLSSDDEGNKQSEQDRGKENTPPIGYEAPLASSNAASATRSSTKAPKTNKTQVRRKIVKADEMDDGQRSPLSDLEAEDFYAAGLSKDSYVIVHAAADKSEKATDLTSAELARQVAADLFASRKSRPVNSGLIDLPVVTGDGDFAGDIVIWDDETNGEDTPASPVAHTGLQSAVEEKRKRCFTDDVAGDENVLA